VRIFNNFLHLVEIKAVLEGRGFRPNFLGKKRLLELTSPNNGVDWMGEVKPTVSYRSTYK
jgi:hypothetical protein